VLIRGKYQGASFFELLEVDFPHLHPTANAREFVEAKGAPPTREDVDAVARGQLAREERARREASRMIVQDTDLLSTVVYSRHYFGDCPPWIVEALRGRTPDLYLLVDVDVPWVADGEQRDRGNRREEMHALFREALREVPSRFVEVRGLGPLRMAAAVAAIDAVLGDHRP